MYPLLLGFTWFIVTWLPDTDIVTNELPSEIDQLEDVAKLLTEYIPVEHNKVLPIIWAFEQNSKQLKLSSLFEMLSNSNANQLPFRVLKVICSSFMFVVLCDVVKLLKGIAFEPVGGVEALYFTK